MGQLILDYVLSSDVWLHLLHLVVLLNLLSGLFFIIVLVFRLILALALLYHGILNQILLLSAYRLEERGLVEVDDASLQLLEHQILLVFLVDTKEHADIDMRQVVLLEVVAMQ